MSNPKELAEKWISEQPVFNSAVDIFLAGYNAANEWAAVQHKLPENSGDLLIYINSRDIKTVYYDQPSNSWCDSNHCYYPSHWLPLPEKPKS